MQLPGDHFASGFWPAFWVMGNLARAGGLPLPCRRCWAWRHRHHDVAGQCCSRQRCGHTEIAAFLLLPAGHMKSTGGFWPYTYNT